jgi:GNAT superfamily N-acetyltransferase
MNDIEIQATVNPDSGDVKIINDGIIEYNKSKVGPQRNVAVGCFAREGDDVIGGITGNLFWNYLYIDIMWIDEKYRRNGIGRQLIEKIERLSVDNGISRSHQWISLSTETVCTGFFRVEFGKSYRKTRLTGLSNSSVRLSSECKFFYGYKLVLC